MIGYCAKTKVSRVGCGLLGAALILVIGCSPKQAGQLNECLAREASIQAQLGQCQTGAQQLVGQIEAAVGKAKKCQDEITTMQSKLNAAEAELTQLKQTPASVSQEIIATIDSATTVVDLDVILGQITAFNDRFPTAPEKSVLARRSSELKKLRLSLQKEEARARALESIADIRNTLSEAVDGSELSFTPLAKLAALLVSRDMKYNAISELPRTNFAEAMKDSDAERGKSMVVSGRVLQITKEADYYVGLICTGSFCNNVYHFVTAGTTRGINGDSSAMFAGVFAQRYSYSNAGGGTTHSLALVGYFKGQE